MRLSRLPASAANLRSVLAPHGIRTLGAGRNHGTRALGDRVSAGRVGLNQAKNRGKKAPNNLGNHSLSLSELIDWHISPLEKELYPGEPKRSALRSKARDIACAAGTITSETAPAASSNSGSPAISSTPRSPAGAAIVLGGPYNSGVLAGRAMFNYGDVPAAVAARVKALRTICDAHGVELRAAALQFVAAHPLIVSVISRFPLTRRPAPARGASPCPPGRGDIRRWWWRPPSHQPRRRLPVASSGAIGHLPDSRCRSAKNQFARVFGPAPQYGP